MKWLTPTTWWTVLAVLAIAPAATAQMCTVDADCNDHNPCTINTCAGGTCQMTFESPGVSCGLPLGNPCTQPDTCDGAGNCDPNDEPDGTPCLTLNNEGGLCQAGLCAPPRFAGSLLPESSILGGEPRRMIATLLASTTAGATSNVTLAHIAGVVIDTGGLFKAAVWEAMDDSAYTLSLLPTPLADPSQANSIVETECNGVTQVYVATGSTMNPPMPTAWSCEVTNCGTTSQVMSPWSVEVIPAPPIATEGNLTDGELQLTGTDITAVGSVVLNADRKAMVWKRDAVGNWSPPLPLPDDGVGTDSEARNISGYSATSTVGAVIAGSADDTSGVMLPAAWVESLPGSDTYTLYRPPLPEGAAGGRVNHVTVFPTELPLFPTDQFLLSGEVMLNDMTTRGVIWITDDFATWDLQVLPPALGFANSTAVAGNARTAPLSSGMIGSRDGGATAYAAGATADMEMAISGVSYNTDIETDGHATHYEWDWYLAGNFSPRGLTDLTRLDIGGDPSHTRLAVMVPADWIVVKKPVEPNPELRAGVLYQDPVGQTASSGAAPIPHPYAFRGRRPAPIPAASTWGLVAFALALLAGGQVVMLRRRSRTQRA